MIIFLYGADNYRSEQRLKTLIRAFAQKYGELNCLTLAGKELTSADDLTSLAASGSLFGEKRLVVLKNLLSEHKNKELFTAIAAQIKAGLFSAPDGNVLIFYESGDKLGNSALAKLLKQQKAEEFKQLTGSQLNRFIYERTKALGSNIEPAAVNLLAANAADLFALENEIKKLVVYKQADTMDAVAGTITAADVEEICTQAVTGHIFTFTDYLGQRQADKALAELNKLRLSGQDEFFIFAMVTKHVRNLIMLADLGERQLTPAQIAAKTKLHPFVIKKAWAQSKQFSLAELADLYQQLLVIDRQTKKGELVDSTLALDKLVLGLALA